MYSSDDFTDTGTLNVWLVNLKTQEKIIIWRLSSSQGNEWKEGTLAYSNEESHEIIFEGIKGLARGHIALGMYFFLVFEIILSYLKLSSFFFKNKR